MKLKIATATLLLSLAFSASAADMVCKDQLTNSPTHYTVTITDLAGIADQVPYGKHYDSVAKVLVEFKQTSGSKTLFKKTFEAVSVAYDVEYRISAVKKHGFKFWTYFDEADQSGVELTNTDGSKARINMTCVW